MQLSRHADYALRIVLDLAPGSSSRIADIARRRRAPSAFLAKIARDLIRAGLLRSFRGRKGGVALARPASRITVLQVIEAVDGPLALNRCVPSGAGCPLSRSCPAHPLWMKLQKIVADELKAVTIESLLREAGSKPVTGLWQNPPYCICPTSASAGEPGSGGTRRRIRAPTLGRSAARSGSGSEGSRGVRRQPPVVKSETGDWIEPEG